MIKTISISAAIYTLAISVGSFYYLNTNFAISVLAGGGLMLINIAALTFSWGLIFSKKSIALAVFVIIFKYVILGMIIWILSSSERLNIVGLLIGLASLVFAVMMVMLIKSFANKNL